MAQAELAASNADLQKLVYDQIQIAAQPVATALNMPNMVPIDEGSLGDFPWYWQNGTNFNNKTYSWLNNVFSYNQDGYINTSNSAFTTAYFNVLMDTAYVLDAADAGALNTANLANAAVINTVVTDWTTTQGAIPPTYNTQIAQLNYIMTQVLTWGNQGLTLGQLRNSTNPMSLLPNIPLGANQLVSDLMTYLANTSSVANIQAAVLSFNNQLAQTRLNISPAPATVGTGWMQTSDDNGNLLIVPQVTVQESTGNIQNNLLPSSGTGKSFTASFSASQGSSNTVDVSVSGGGGGAIGDIFFFIGIYGSASASLNIFSADSSQQSADVSFTFNGVTTVTPTPAPYDITSGKGWFNPEPIADAVNYNPNKSGYKFTPAPPYTFGTDGDFGYLSRLMISQQPIMTLTYNTSNYAAYQKTFQQQSSWGISFLGIPLGGGSQSYYSSTTSYDSSSQTVTVTMTPVGNTTPVTPTDQLAYVVGGEVDWLGA